ncbi:MAG: Co2+/Mg2+ efflux protein ApaG [Pseudomonadales bacterium]|nr:Co2+/Mg2+ efflux protein ApaG [Pseudomonadales bacterium]
MAADASLGKQIKVIVTPEFQADDSNPESKRFVFSYEVKITNHSEENVQLVERSWVVTDAEQQIQRVQGKGVVGQQPELAPGETFAYGSALMLETPFGTLEGAYTFQTTAKDRFDVPIPAITLAKPNSLH